MALEARRGDLERRVRRVPGGARWPPRLPASRSGRPRIRFYAGGLAGYDSIRFPSVVLDCDDDGSRLHLAVRQGFLQVDGDAYSRRLDTEWSLDDADLIDTACGIVGRDLTEEEWAKYIGASVPYRATCSTA